EAQWPVLQEGAVRRLRAEGSEDLLARTWEAVSAHDGADPALAADLLAALARQSGPGDLHNGLGLTLTLVGPGPRPTTTALAQVAAGHFRDAVTSDPRHLIAGLNLVEAMAALGQQTVAIEGARRALAALARGQGLTPRALDGIRFPPGYDFFRVEWERA